MAEQAKLRKRLEALLKLPENQICADCKKRGPRWASANLGTFFCIECSGIHRNLGVHISFVRSVNLDSWTPEQVEFMEQWGNDRANSYYEANVPSHVHRPKEGDPVRVIERFIRDKYEHKRYIADHVPERVHTESNTSDQAKVPPSRRALRNAAAKSISKAAPTHTPTATEQATVVAAASQANSIAATTAPIVETPSLIDFLDDPAPVSSNNGTTGNTDPFSGQQSHFPTVAANSQIAGNNEMSFPSNSQNGQILTSNGSNTNEFMVTGAQNQQQIPDKAKASADAILSLYSGGSMVIPGVHSGGNYHPYNMHNMMQGQHAMPVPGMTTPQHNMYQQHQPYPPVAPGSGHHQQFMQPHAQQQQFMQPHAQHQQFMQPHAQQQQFMQPHAQQQQFMQPHAQQQQFMQSHAQQQQFMQSHAQQQQFMQQHNGHSMPGGWPAK